MKFNQNTAKILVKNQFIPDVSSKDLYLYYALFSRVLNMTSHPSLKEFSPQSFVPHGKIEKYLKSPTLSGEKLVKIKFLTYKIYYKYS